jgi:drug/metabolite transporter (DMT)-like permease
MGAPQKALHPQSFEFLGAVMQEKSRNSSRGYLIGLSATVFLSFTGILISYLNRAYHLPSLVLAFWRDCFVALGLIIVFTFFKRSRLGLDRAHWVFFILYGLTLSLFNSLWTFSVQFNGAAIATVLAFSSPAMTAVLAHFILKEQINGVKLSSIGMSLLGTALVSGAVDPSAWKVNASGIIFGLLTGLFFAIYTLLGKTSSNKSIDPWTTMLYGFSSAVFFLFLFNLITNVFTGQALFSNFLWLGTSLSGWAILIFLGIGPTVGGYGLYLMSLGYLPATIANLIGALEPAFTAIWAYMIFHEQLTIIQFIGSLLVFASVFLLRLGEGNRRSENPPTVEVS